MKYMDNDYSDNNPEMEGGECSTGDCLTVNNLQAVNNMGDTRIAKQKSNASRIQVTAVTIIMTTYNPMKI